MNLEVLLHRLQLEAEEKADLQWKQTRLDLVKRKAEKPPTVTQSSRQEGECSKNSNGKYL
jgi:hypothetical protein